MTRYFIAALILIGFADSSCIHTKESKSVGGVSTTVVKPDAKLVAMETDVLTLINNYRKTKGSSALKMNTVISEEARKHSENMANGKVPFGHDGFATRSKTITTKLPATMGVAENVAYGQITAKEVVNDWIKSTGHRLNIEASYTQTGIGIVADKSGVLYYTQIFTR